MDQNKEIDTSLITMISDYMEKGFLENIIDMFRHDSSLYSLVGQLIQDERVRVRIGITAMVEELKKLDERHISMAVPNLIPLLTHHWPHVRGDAANLLGVIGQRDAIPYLEKLLTDEDANVRIIAREALEDIKLQN